MQIPSYLKIGLIFSIIFVQTTTTLAAWSAINHYRAGQAIPIGVLINGVPIGGLKLEEAAARLQNAFDTELEKQLVLKAGNQIMHISLVDIDAHFNYTKAINKALDMQQPQGIARTLTNNMKLLGSGLNIPLELTFNSQKLTDKLQDLKKQIDRKPTGAIIKWENNERHVIPEQEGINLDIPSSIAKISKLGPPLSPTIKLVTKKNPAPVSAADLKPLQNILGECETKLDLSQQNRTHNIELAIQAINNTLVKTGEVFSYNQQVGERTAANGFKKAPVIEGDRVVDGYGGGICQLSSTLYNTLLLANLEIIERHPHTKTVSYVAPGLDATVAYGQQDLRFRNNSEHSIFITAHLEDHGIAVRIWGVIDENQPLADILTELTPLDPKVIIRKQASLGKGQQKVLSSGKRGYIAKVYKVFKTAPGETKKLVSKDYYAPEHRIILMGTGDVTETK
ncbi:Vancomycin resistance protein YoaR, contains peptidoglycan-binding and VanW domains [Desulfotomaculum arcticum]|uniref:Vancomycin resistance protein YoaR, contains peptidoglycan-binding and VanW domains n=1 Tax=Desulfotruncus arcticus DSM 17038 TaxID=1121424 RepID=A0A1I2YGJ9_9FIRM|nr:Vancomycin resistance protein YoaR, contains peptidoglycan-binding and VanW domains [Desulfotomaculum arcticum] [Desulfotruncus arcticus DSM 17038]